jgi:hypothetical protein
MPELYRQILESGRAVYQPQSAAAGDQLSPAAAAAAADQLLCFVDAVGKLLATPHQLEGGEMNKKIFKEQKTSYNNNMIHTEACNIYPVIFYPESRLYR